MKVAMIAETYLPMLGGAEIHVTKLAHTLSKQGVEVEIVTNCTNGDNLDGKIPIYRYPGDFSPQKIIKNFLQIKKIVKRADIIHSHYSNRLSFLAGIYSFFSKKPLVVTLHGFGTMNEHFPFFKRLVLNFIKCGSLKLSRKVISTSQEMFDIALKSIPLSKLKLIPNGVDTEEFSPFIDIALKSRLNPKNKTIVMAIRRLIEKNGVQYLLEVVPNIIAKKENIHFIIVGTGSLESYLKKRVRELGVENYVTFTGKVNNAQVKNYLSIADVVVFPSAAESSSIACLEAMSMSKAVIASRIGGYVDIIKDGVNGLFVKLFDDTSSHYETPLTLPEVKLYELSNLIISLIDNEQLRLRLGENARNFVREYYDWKIIADKTLDLYGQCLKRH